MSHEHPRREGPAGVQPRTTSDQVSTVCCETFLGAAQQNNGAFHEAVTKVLMQTGSVGTIRFGSAEVQIKARIDHEGLGAASADLHRGYRLGAVHQRLGWHLEGHIGGVVSRSVNGLGGHRIAPGALQVINRGDNPTVESG